MLKKYDIVLYKKGDTYLFGKIKRISDDGKKAFVWYHMGYTAACTPIELLTKVNLEDLVELNEVIQNNYQIELIFLKTEESNIDNFMTNQYISHKNIETWVDFYNAIPNNKNKLFLPDVVQQLNDDNSYKNYYNLIGNLMKLIINKEKELKINI